MLLIAVPEIAAASCNFVTYELPVTFHLLDESRITVKPLAVCEASVVPVSTDPRLRWITAELILSTTIDPESFCPVALMVAVPPLEPVVPQLPAAASSRIPETADSVTPERLTVPLAFVA